MANVHPAPEQEEPDGESGNLNRRRLLTYLVAAPALTLATRIGLDTAAPETAEAAVPSLPGVPDILDLGDALIVAGLPTSGLLVLEVRENGTVRLELPRAEVGQGINTAVAMLVADEMDLPLDHVDIPLSDARPELLFNQLTGGSNSVRSLYHPVRATAALARARLIAAASHQWHINPETLTTKAGQISLPTAAPPGTAHCREQQPTPRCPTPPLNRSRNRSRHSSAPPPRASTPGTWSPDKPGTHSTSTYRERCPLSCADRRPSAEQWPQWTTRPPAPCPESSPSPLSPPAWR